jgi:hypothetical protein
MFFLGFAEHVFFSFDLPNGDSTTYYSCVLVLFAGSFVTNSDTYNGK